jgi:hypothetical protein
VARDLAQPSIKKEIEALWKRFLADQAVQKALHRVILKALHRVVLRDSEDRVSLFNRLRPGKKWRRKLWGAGEKDPRPDPVSERCRRLGDLLCATVPTDLRYELLATVWAPKPAHTQQKKMEKIRRLIAKLNREQPPNYEEAVAALLRGAGAPVREKGGQTRKRDMVDRRKLSRWAKRQTGTYCDAEVATILTVARRVRGHRKHRVSERSLTTDRKRNPEPHPRVKRFALVGVPGVPRHVRRITLAELKKMLP